jgi:TP901 family phage tail tape measure protein
MADNPINYNDLFAPLGPGSQELQEFSAAVQGLNRNYRNFAKNIGEDSQRVKGVIDALTVQAGQLRSQATDINLLNDKERAGMAALAAEAAKLAQERQRLETVLAAQARAQARVKDATTEATSALRAQQNELREAFKAGDTVRIEKAALALRQTRAETMSLSAALRGANSEFSAAKGSYDALDAENKKLIASFKALEGGIGAGSGEALRLQKQIAANTETLKAFDENILVFNRNVGNYKGGFSGLIAELAKARAAQAAMTQGTAEAARQQMVVSGFQTAAQKSAAQMGLSYEQAEAKINGATAALQPLATSLLRLEKEQVQVAKTTGEESEQYRKLGFQIQQTKKQLDDVAVATTQVEAKQQSFGQQIGLNRAGFEQYLTQLAAGYVGFQALAGAVQAVFTLNVEYSRNLAEVRKTTGLTADEANRLADSLKQLDTPTTLAGLLKIASVGGQLGVAKGQLLEFTAAIDTAVQALGNDFTGGAEEIATVLGRLTSIFRKELGPDQAQNILAIGSAINQISADGSSTAPFLTDVTQRVGALSTSTRLGIANALAYAAVLQEQGYSAEVSGTALNRLFGTLSIKSKQAYEIAKIANPALTLKEFTTLINTDFNQAIQVFLKGLREGGKSTTEQARLLATLKLQSGEAKSAIVTLSQNTDLFAQRQATANEQLRDATSLAAEAAVNTDTLAGSVDKNTNAVKNFFTTGTGSSVLKFLIDVEAELFKLVAVPFQAIGDGFAYLKEKTGLAKPPLDDYTLSIVANTLATAKQAQQQQGLLDSYAKLLATTSRTGAQELELSKLRAQAVATFGTAEVAAIQASIDKRKESVAINKQSLTADLELFNKSIDEASTKAARAQDALNVQLSGKTAEQVKGILTAAEARLDATTKLSGKSLIPDSQISAAQRLIKAERDLAEQQRIRANILAALQKLGVTDAQQKQDDAAATDAQAAAEEQLDRAAQQRAKNRVAALRDELADNEDRLKRLRVYQAEQAKLLEDRQITPDASAANNKGSEDVAIQIQRDGAAIRIQIARAEAAERLAEAENDRIRQRKKKDITEAELTDIQQQYALRRQDIFRQEGREIARIQQKLRDDLKVEPLEFKVAVVDIDKFKADLREVKTTYEQAMAGVAGNARYEMAVVTQQFADGLISRQKYEDKLFDIRKAANKRLRKLRDDFHKDENEQDLQDAQDSLEALERLVAKRIKIIEKAAYYTQEVDTAYFAIRGNLVDAQIQRENDSYEQQIKVAGDNAALKAKIEEDHDKRLKKLNYEKAKLERDSALASIAISTAVAVAKAFAEYVFPFALLPAGIALAEGALQTAVVLSKPLPSYFVGRKDGPAEFANLGEQGAELAGQEKTGFRLYTKPTVGYLQAGDRVYTAPQTKQILAENKLVEGRLVQRQYNNDLEQQTVRLRVSAAQREQAQQRAVQQSNAHVVQELQGVRKAIQEQEYYRLNEQDDLVRRSHRANGWRDTVHQRYKHGRG